MDTTKQWLKWLPWDEFRYNSSYHSSICMTPFEVVYRWLPPKIISYELNYSTVTEVDSLLLTRDIVLQTLKEFLSKAQKQMV